MIWIALWLYDEKNISNMLFKDFLITFLFFKKNHCKTENRFFFPAVNQPAKKKEVIYFPLFN